MGVQNLWVLLAPVGRQVELDSLAGEALAVDASIWLTQFVKAMRDDEGRMIRNAHLVGTFRRVARLLFHGVRPVFVFDGDTPEIKKRTTAKRRRRQENQAANLRQTAQRILINQIKMHREELKKTGGAPAPAIDPNFLIPEATPQRPTNSVEAPPDQVVEPDEASGVEEGKDEAERSSPAGSQLALGDEAASVESEEELTVDDIDLDTSRLSKIDLHAVFSLPPHLQKDMVQKILRDRRQEVRDKFIPLAGQPEAYSHVQISSFLATVKLTKRIEAARREKTQEELQSQEAASSPGTGSGHILGHGKRIASNSSKFFIYEKADDKKVDDRLHKGKSGRQSQSISDATDDSDDDSRSERELMTDLDKTAEVEASAAGVETYGLSLDERFMPNKRRRQSSQGPEPGKMSLSDFSIQGFAAQAEQQMRQQQEAQWDVDEARAAWLARHHLQAKHEPELAIEKARRARLGLPGSTSIGDSASDPRRVQPVAAAEGKPNMPAKRAAAGGGAIESSNKEDVPGMLAKLQSVGALPSSEEQTEADKPSAEAIHMIGEGNADDEGDDDDDIEWEDVDESTNNPVPSVLATALDEVAAPQTSNRDPTPIGIVANSEGENASLNPEGLDESIPRVVSRPESIELSDSDTDDRREDDMMLTLRSEMEDAKAEEDLNLLKEEALQSAMVTASNLTQWAAGAVRRALEAHTQHGKKSPSLEAGQSWTPARLSPGKEKPSPGKRSPVKAKLVDLSAEDEEEKTKMPTVDDQHGEEADGDASDAQLQKALEASFREESAVSASSKSRYLQYSSPTASISVDVSAAIPSAAASANDDGATIQSLEREQRELKKLRSRQQRDVEGVNDEMVQDVMELLRLFGVPYLVCPMEAEAQCAALEMLGLVNGIITDDSDIFPFGGSKVYKNIFHNQKFVEAFYAQDIQKELGFSREDVIALAMLLGSDYTDGVRGIGIVNATEVVNAFPGIDGLREFKQWVQAFDLDEETRRAASRKKKTDAELEKMTSRERFEHTHASARRKWELGEAFPNTRVVQAYLSPQVDRSEERFSWSLPDLAGLRTFCTRTFGWDQAKTDGALLPLMERAAAAANAAAGPGRAVQTRIDHFFRSYDDQVKFAKIKSKRLRSAVEGRTMVKTAGVEGQDVVVIDDDDKEDEADGASTATTTTSRFFKKKKTSMAAVTGGQGRGNARAATKRKTSTKK